MARLFNDRVMATTTTTGTGAITLGSAVAGHQAFAAAIDDTFDYTIFGVDGASGTAGEWETGTGTFTDAGTTFTRAVAQSSNADALVDFAAGTKHVALTVISSTIEALLAGSGGGGSSGGEWVPIGTDGQPLTGTNIVAWDHAVDGNAIDGVLINNLDQYSEVMVVAHELRFRTGDDVTAVSTYPCVYMSTDNGATIIETLGTVVENSTNGITSNNKGINGAASGSTSAKTLGFDIQGLNTTARFKPYNTTRGTNGGGYINIADPINAFRISHQLSDRTHILAAGSIAIFAR
jgi:hypothetical protein